MKESHPVTFFLVHSALASEHAKPANAPSDSPGQIHPHRVVSPGLRNCSPEVVGRSLSVVFISRAESTQ